jgi:hypothetical protein
MAGTSGDTIYGANFDFSGQAIPAPTMLLDGQLLIGSTALNAGGTHCNVSTLTAGTGIAITNGAGSIIITNTGGGGGGGGTTSLMGNSGSATQSGGVIGVVGATNITTTGSGNTLTITPTLNLLALANLSGTGYIVQTGANTFVERTFVAGAGISLSNPDGVAGATTITASAIVPIQFTEDSGSAVPSGGNLNIIGTSAQGITTSGAGSTVTLTIANASAVQKGVASFNATEFTVTAGVVTSNGFGITAGTGLSGGGSENLGGSVTISLTVPVVVSNGGTGATSLTTDGVLYGNGTSPVGVTSPGSNGQVLIGATGAAPAFGTVGGTQGITLTTGANTLSIGLVNVPNSALANSSITLSNGNNITITGSPVSLGGTATVNVSGTTTNAVQIGNGAGSLTSLTLGTNGQVLIGGTGVAPAFALLTSTDNSISFTTGTNTLNLKANTPASTLTLTPNSGAAISPAANNINVQGLAANSGGNAYPIFTYNGGSAQLNIENRTYLTPYVVDASSTDGSKGTFTSIGAALTQAASDSYQGDIFIRAGTYTENPALVSGINLTALGGDELTPTVTIIGKCSFSSAGTVTISNIRLQTNSDNFLAVTGSAASKVNLENCYLNCLNNTGISYSTSSSSATLFITKCTGDLGTTGIGIYTMSSPGDLIIEQCYFTNSGGSTTASSNSAGSAQFGFCRFFSPFSTSSSGQISPRNCRILCNTLNTTAITHNATGGSSASSAVSQCVIRSGSASAISIGAGAELDVVLCDINSSNTNAITGSGTLDYAGLCFSGSGVAVNTTTQTLNSMGPRIQLSGGPQLLSGSGSPSGSVTAPQGSIWFRTDGTTINNRAYINTNSGTGWTALTTVG